jgi:hypothetical protein
VAQELQGAAKEKLRYVKVRCVRSSQGWIAPIDLSARTPRPEPPWTALHLLTQALLELSNVARMYSRSRLPEGRGRAAWALKSMGVARPQDDGGPDVGTWKTIMAEYVEAGANWLDTPWLTAEFYFYR